MPHIPGRPTEGHGASVKKRAQTMNPGQAQRTNITAPRTESPELRRFLASLSQAPAAAPGFEAGRQRQGYVEGGWHYHV